MTRRALALTAAGVAALVLVVGIVLGAGSVHASTGVRCGSAFGGLDTGAVTNYVEVAAESGGPSAPGVLSTLVGCSSAMSTRRLVTWVLVGIGAAGLVAAGTATAVGQRPRTT